MWKDLMRNNKATGLHIYHRLQLLSTSQHRIKSWRHQGWKLKQTAVKAAGFRSWTRVRSLSFLQTSWAGGWGGDRQTDSRSQTPLESGRDADAALLFWEKLCTQRRKWRRRRRRKWNKQDCVITAQTRMWDVTHDCRLSQETQEQKKLFKYLKAAIINSFISIKWLCVMGKLLIVDQLTLQFPPTEGLNTRSEHRRTSSNKGRLQTASKTPKAACKTTKVTCKVCYKATVRPPVWPMQDEKRPTVVAPHVACVWINLHLNTPQSSASTWEETPLHTSRWLEVDSL